jgi:lipopolysaccharide heptosyltransferase II
MVERLRAGRFDAAVIFTVYSQNPLPAALLCYLADVPLRLAHCHENPYQLLTDWVPDPEPERMTRHEVRRQLDLVASVGCRSTDERLSLRVAPAARRRVASRLDQLRIDRERPWLLVHPGATAPSRRYPPEAFAQVARRLAVDGDWQLVFTGTAPEVPLVESIRQAMGGAPSSSIAGQIGLDDLVALIAEAPLLLSNNTGPVHIAAAVGTPVVDLYALTNPQHTPWAVPSRVLSHDVPCKWCYKSVCPEGHNNCLTLVTPESVVRAVAELYAETAVRLPARDRRNGTRRGGRRRSTPRAVGAL